jgi:GNAT superfamily N-acetyltransferase
VAVLNGGDSVSDDSDLSDEAMGRHVAQAQAGQVPVQAKAAAFGKTSVLAPPKRTSVKIRLADGLEADCLAGIHLAREAHRHTIFRDIPFSEKKARAIYAKAVAQPERFGLIFAVPGADEPLAEDGLLGFASVHAGEHFLGTGALIATVQTLNISQKLSGTLLGGKVALRLVQAVRHWARTRGCVQLMVHVTNGDNAEDADRFFRRCGMVTVGGNYVSVLSKLTKETD